MQHPQEKQPFYLTEEERRTLIAEGLPVPTGLPLTKVLTIRPRWFQFFKFAFGSCVTFLFLHILMPSVITCITDQMHGNMESIG